MILTTSSGSNSIALVNLGIKVYEITGIKKQIVKWFTGKTILVVGIEGSGKTTFVQYLEYGVFDDESRHKKTRLLEETPTFSVKTGRDGALELNVKTAVEVPGQFSPEHHAMFVREYEPSALLIFTDLSRADESYQWVKDFCNTLEDEWRGHSNSKIQSIIIVLNKQDKVSLDIGENWLPKFREVVAEKLKFARGNISADSIQSLPCITISNLENTKYIDSLITKLALDLQR